MVLLCFIIPVENLDGGRGAVKGPFGLRVQNGWAIQGAVLVLASCLWISANLSELAYAARDMNHTMLAVGGVALAVLLVLALWLYAVTRGDAKKRRAFRWGAGRCGCAGRGGQRLRTDPYGRGAEP